MDYNNTIASLIADNLSRDQIIITLVTEYGCTLNKAQNEYAAYAKAHNLSSAPTSHKEGALDALRELYADNMTGWTAMAVRDHVIEFQADYEIAESTARDYCKAFSDEMGVTHPVLDPRRCIFDWFKAHDLTNPAADHYEDLDEMKSAYIDFATNTCGRSRSNANEYWKGYELHLELEGYEA